MTEIPLTLFLFPLGLLLGFLLDLIFGDPAILPHPVVGIGHLIHLGERIFRRLLPSHERIAGAFLVLFVVFVVAIFTAGILALSWVITPWLTFATCIVMSWQVLSARGLGKETMKVYQRVASDDLSGARKEISLLVGRETKSLSMEQVIKASVETVAENTSDGVTAPMLYLAIGGPVLGMVYKAINTMDSMVGYKNERYLNFGCVAAKVDDAANFIPSRVTAFFMIAASYLLRFDGRNARKIYLRDRRRHASPNSAQTESVCAGALQVALAGDAVYFGKLYAKPVIGDPLRAVCAQDIRSAIRLMYGTSLLFLPVVCAFGALFWFAVGRLI